MRTIILFGLMSSLAPNARGALACPGRFSQVLGGPSVRTYVDSNACALLVTLDGVMR
jgi:hypothetical protein